jgi:hypothetical protein
MQNKRHKRGITRAVIEAAFIIFLFYANLLMGDFTHSGNANGKSLGWALYDVFTITNFEIALIAALVGHLFFEYLRGKL